MKRKTRIKSNPVARVASKMQTRVVQSKKRYKRRAKNEAQRKENFNY